MKLEILHSNQSTMEEITNITEIYEESGSSPSRQYDNYPDYINNDFNNYLKYESSILKVLD
jgi:hypothetical protein